MKEMNEKINKDVDELYNQWRKIIDKLAGMNSASLECTSLRNKALEFGYQYYRKTGRNVALHTF